MTEQDFKDTKELWKLTYAKGALQQAIDATEYLLMHNVSFDHPLYDLLTVTIFTSYARPFSQSRPFGSLSTDAFSTAELDFHTNNVIAFRNRLFAHSDALANASPTHGLILQVKCDFIHGQQPKPDPSILKLPLEKLKMLLQFIYSIRDVIARRAALIIDSFEKDRPATDNQYTLNVYDQNKAVWLSLDEVKQIPLANVVMLDVIDAPTQ